MDVADKAALMIALANSRMAVNSIANPPIISPTEGNSSNKPLPLERLIPLTLMRHMVDIKIMLPFGMLPLLMERNHQDRMELLHPVNLGYSALLEPD